MTVQRRFGSQNLLTLLALLAGVACGLLVFRLRSRVGLEFAAVFEAIGTLWTNAMRLVVIPLIVSMLVVAVARHGSSRRIGRITGLSLVTFIVLLLTGVLFVLLTAPPILSRIPRYESVAPSSSSGSPTKPATQTKSEGDSGPP
ncbi:MAG: cation:dicarboxylase symporter family transporter, partial [Acidobacteriota bacterium]